MNIRRERMHQCGLTNLDARSKGEMSKSMNKSVDFGTMGRTQFKNGISPSLEFKD